jgi:hypothetical protein
VIAARPRLAGLGEGTVVGRPEELQPEARDREPLQAFIAVLLVIEVLLFALALSGMLFVVAASIVVLGLIAGGGLAWLGAGCMMQAVRLPLQLLRTVFRPIVGAINPGAVPTNLRQVREYRLNLAAGEVNAFVVKGNMAPRTLQPGDYVRVRTTPRNHRPYFARGELRDADTGDWVPLALAEARTGVYWLIGFLVMTGILIYIYFALLQRR